MRLVKDGATTFKFVFERAGVCAEESVFIDDNLANIAAAASLGFQTERCQTAYRLERRLAAILRHVEEIKG